MGKISLFIILLILSLVSGLSAQEVKNCPCGYGEGVECIPCGQEGAKPVPRVEDSEVKDCECGYNAFGGCIPCDDVGKEGSEGDSRDNPIQKGAE